MSAPQMTQDELAESAENPVAYWKKVHEKNMQNVDVLTGAMRDTLSPIMARYLGTFRAVIEAQSREITIHRSFESLMRQEKGGEEDAIAYLNALTELRYDLAARAKAATEAAYGKAQ